MNFNKTLNLWEDYVLDNHLHIIAFDTEYLLGRIDSNGKAVYATQTYSSDLLSEMPNDYQTWVKELFDSLHIEAQTVETETEYFETLKFLV